MKKYSIAVCVCAVLFSVGIHGGGMREVFANAAAIRSSLQLYPAQMCIRDRNNSSWKCQCGAENTGKFCEYCGQPRPF